MKPTEPEIDPALPTTVTPSGRVVYDPLQARRIKVDGGAVGEMSQLLGEMRALDDRHDDVRDAVPVPVALAPSSGGALITEVGQDAASAHVEAPVPEPAAAGRVESSAVKIVDPRRAPTVRIEKKSPWVVGAGMGEVPIDREALPSATAASSRPAAGGGASSNRTAAIVIGGVVVAGLVAFFVMRRPPEVPHESTTGATSVMVPESGTGVTSATEAAPLPSTAGNGSMASGTTAASAETTSSAAATTTSPEPTGSAPGTMTSAPGTTASATPSVTSATPRTTGDPYDAGAAPKPTAGAGTTAPVVSAVPSMSPSAPPAVSSAPSSKPTASSTPGPSDTSFVIQPKGHLTP